MQEELNEAGGTGYRFAGTQGGETAFGGSEAVVVMVLDPEGRRFRHLLLATSRTGAMQQELNELPPEFDIVGMTVFSSTFGGKEAAIILEAQDCGVAASDAGSPGASVAARPSKCRFRREVTVADWWTSRRAAR